MVGRSRFPKLWSAFRKDKMSSSNGANQALWDIALSQTNPDLSYTPSGTPYYDLPLNDPRITGADPFQAPSLPDSSVLASINRADAFVVGPAPDFLIAYIEPRVLTGYTVSPGYTGFSTLAEAQDYQRSMLPGGASKNFLPIFIGIGLIIVIMAGRKRKRNVRI